MKGKPYIIAGLAAAILTLVGWVLIRVNVSRDIILPSRVRTS